MKLLMPTLKKIIRYQFLLFFVGIMNSHHKIVSVHGAPLKSRRECFPREAFHEGTNFFGQRGCSK